MRTLGYFRFTDEKNRKDKEEMYKQVGVDKLYVGNGEDSFFEFLNTVLNEDDTLVITSFDDFGSEFMQLLRALDYIKHSEIKVIVLEGVHNEYFCGVSTGQAAKDAKDFHKMLATGQIM